MSAAGRTRPPPPHDPCALTMRSFLRGDSHVIALAGDLDLITAAEVDRELRRVERTSVHTIAVDLQALAFIDSTGIRLLLQAARRSATGSNRLTVVRASAAVQRLFHICGVDDVLPFVDELPPRRTGHAEANRRLSQAALAGAIREQRTP
ncbi:MAG: anti-sigma factor antagonist [Solirubrobacteraceae bacterium]|nr:anti-sigma factor antagonist [Pseudonocardiales bacterium]MEA2183879.1 anti-sigma factor antagonist [Solirubrobacteraceae bacterium]